MADGDGFECRSCGCAVFVRPAGSLYRDGEDEVCRVCGSVCVVGCHWEEGAYLQWCSGADDPDETDEVRAARLAALEDDRG